MSLCYDKVMILIMQNVTVKNKIRHLKLTSNPTKIFAMTLQIILKRIIMVLLNLFYIKSHEQLLRDGIRKFDETQGGG